MKSYPAHPLALEFPPLGEEEYNELAESIEQNGLLNEIILYDGQVLDGIHRQKACLERNVEPRYRELPADTDIEGYVRALNLDRRHLMRMDALTIALKIVKSGYKKGSAAVPPSVSNKAIKQKSGASDRQARRAKAVVEGAIDPILDFAKQKIISTETAAKIAKLEKKHQKTAAERIAQLRKEGFKTITFEDLRSKPKEKGQSGTAPQRGMKSYTTDNLADFYSSAPAKPATPAKAKKPYDPFADSDDEPPEPGPDEGSHIVPGQYDPSKPPLPGGLDAWDPRSIHTPAPNKPRIVTIEFLQNCIEPFLEGRFKHPDQPRKCLTDFIAYIEGTES